MNVKSRIYLILVFSMCLILFALGISYKNINENSSVIKSIEKEQITLNYFANKLNFDIKKNQTKILQIIILNEKLSDINSISSYQEIRESVESLKKFMQAHKTITKDFDTIIDNIDKRIYSYKAVQDSLLDAVIMDDKEDIQDALIGFNNITVQFSKETQRLINMSNEKLYLKVTELKDNNDMSLIITFVSFLTAIALISFATYRFIILTNRLQKQLSRAELAEEKQSLLQESLLKYNENLENEVFKKAQEIKLNIYTNPLSGLPNRNRLLEDINSQSFAAMALLNIDNFQSFNDIYGENLGNIAIQLSASFLKTKIQNKEMTLYHIGGDEFAVVIIERSYLEKEHFIQKIEKILKAYGNEKFSHDNKEFNLLMSSGVTFSGRRKMLAYADMALKDAKKRNIQLSIFHDDKELEKLHKDDIECHKKLLTAIKDEKIISYFQPIVPIKDITKPLKYESLVRIEESDGKIIAPFKFINVAKANRIYYKITRAILKNTLSVVLKHKVPCSFNISLKDIDNEKTMKMLFDTLDTFEHTELLTVEILETEEFINYEAVYDFCVKIRSYGLKVALDDFGSGYSNFAHILNLPVDYIKIDATLISNIDRDNNSKLMVETIVTLANKLNVETIAEFVSSKEILNIIKEIGVDYAQGFYMGKPEPIERHLENL